MEFFHVCVKQPDNYHHLLCKFQQAGINNYCFRCFCLKNGTCKKDQPYGVICRSSPLSCWKGMISTKIWDGHQPNGRSLYTHYKDSLFFRWDEFIPNIRSWERSWNIWHPSTPERPTPEVYHLQRDTFAWYADVGHLNGRNQGRTCLMGHGFCWYALIGGMPAPWFRVGHYRIHWCFWRRIYWSSWFTVNLGRAQWIYHSQVV